MAILLCVYESPTEYIRSIRMCHERRLYEFEEYEEKQALEEKKRCNDCGVQAGFIHHVCCSCEECPKCGRQFLKCGCERSVETESPYDKDGRRVLLDGTVVINKRLRNARFLEPTGNKIEYLIEAKGF